MKKLITLLVATLSHVTLHAQGVWIWENIDPDMGLRTGRIEVNGATCTIGPGILLRFQARAVGGSHARPNQPFLAARKASIKAASMAACSVESEGYPRRRDSMSLSLRSGSSADLRRERSADRMKSACSFWEPIRKC